MTNVLNKGYVNLVDHMGSDLTVVNAARVSFDKESKWHHDEEAMEKIQGSNWIDLSTRDVIFVSGLPT